MEKNQPSYRHIIFAKGKNVIGNIYIKREGDKSQILTDLPFEECNLHEQKMTGEEIKNFEEYLKQSKKHDDLKKGVSLLTKILKNTAKKEETK